MAAHQAPPSLGFSRQEYWSGLPFPSPMHESEKSKLSHSGKKKIKEKPSNAPAGEIEMCTESTKLGEKNNVFGSERL